MTQRGEDNGQNSASSSAATDYTDSWTATVREQTAIIYDALSEGPIEGLVNGTQSIYVNGNAVQHTDDANTYSAVYSNDVKYVASSGVITDNQQKNVFDGLSIAYGTRWISIYGAAKRANGVARTWAGQTLIKSNDTGEISFAASDRHDYVVDRGVDPKIRIAGAGDDGGEFEARIMRVVNTSHVVVDQPVPTAVNGADVCIDLVDTIASYSSNTCTLTTTGVGVNVANTAALASAPLGTGGTQTPTYNVSNFGYAFKHGYRDQEYLPAPAGLGSASSAYNANKELKQTKCVVASNGSLISNPNEQWNIDLDQSPEPTDTVGYVATASSTMSISNPSEIDRIRISINFPQGLITREDEDGHTHKLKCEFQIAFEYKRTINGSDVWTKVVKFGRSPIDGITTKYNTTNSTLNGTHNGVVEMETGSPFIKTFEFDISQYQPFTDYRLTIKRVSPVGWKGSNHTATNATRITAIENIITDKLRFPHTAYAGVVVDAKDFKSIPKRSYEVRGLKIKVPTNYSPRDEIDPLTGTRRTTASYARNVTTGVVGSTYVDWDGNFRGDRNEFDTYSGVNAYPVYCNNPVWVFMDLLTNPRYGVGRYIDPDYDLSQIDKYQLYALAKYCDELVPDGSGGTEPRFTCNVYIDKSKDAIKMIKEMASVFRGMLMWQNGQVSVMGNREKGAIYTFSKANVIDGMFGYQGTSKRFRTNQIRVTWNDPLNQYKQAIEVVEDHDNIAKTNRITSKNAHAWGCTSQGQAHRYGKWHLFTERLEKEVVSFRTGINAAILRPGDVINIQDPDVNDVQLAGRVSGTQGTSTSTVVYTDRDVSGVIAGTTANYKLHLIYPSGGAYLSQPSAVINSTTYYAGDLVLLDEGGNAVDTEAKAHNVKDDSNELVNLYWSNDVRVETKAISSYNGISVTVSSAFSAVPNDEVMYTITGLTASGDVVTGTSKQFMIINIKQDDKFEFDVAAVAYDKDKFDMVDRGYVIPEIPEISRPPIRTDTIPQPRGFTAEPTLSPDSSGWDIRLEWIHPNTVRVDSEGNTIDDVYEHLAGYEISHNVSKYMEDVDRGFEIISTNSATTNFYVFAGVGPGDYVFRVRTRNTLGGVSGWVQQVITVGEDDLPPIRSFIVGAGLNKYIQRGGILTSGMGVTTSNGTITLAEATYDWTPPSGANTISVSSGNTNFTKQDGFSNLANGAKGYLLYDYDANLARGTTLVDALQPVALATDTVARDPESQATYEFTVMTRLGESDTDLTEITGTGSISANTSTLTGYNSSVFETDFKEGDVIVIDGGGVSSPSNGSHNDSVTTINVDSNSSFPTAGTVLIDDEEITYTGKGTNTLTGCTRGANNTTAASHLDNAVVYYGVTRFWTNVAKVESDSSIIMVKPVARDYANVKIYRQTLRFDLSNDAIIADVVNNAGTFTMNTYTNQFLVNTSLIAINAIVSTHLSANAISSVVVSANSITNVHIASNTIGSVQMAANSIAAAQLKANAIGTSEISANSIAAIHISANTIGSSEISANAVNGTIIAGNSVTGTQIAANSINGIIIATGSVGETHISANAVNTEELITAAVDTLQLANDAIEAAKIAADAVTAGAVAANAINTAEIVTNAVDTLQIAADAITNAKVAADAIDTDQIVDDAVTNATVAADAIAATQLAANAVTASAIAANSIETAEIKSGSVTTAMIAADAITETKIAADTITNASIAAGTIGQSQMAADSIGTANIIAGAIGASEIAANSIGSTAILADAIGQAEIASNSIVAASVVAGSITGTEIAANSIGSAHVVAGSIDTAEIAADAITTAKIEAGAITSAEMGANSIGSANIIAGSIDTAEIASNSIGATAIVAGQIDSSHIAANSIGSTAIVAGAVGSAEVAANSIGSTAIITNSIGQSEIAANSITAAAILANVIGNSEIAANSIDSVVIQANAVGANAVAANSISSAMIAMNSIDTAEIKSDSIVAASIAANAIETAEIKSDAIVTASIAANAIENAEISSTDSMTLTVGGGSTGGWTVNASTLASSDGKVIIDSTNKYILIAD
jgi:predicted phage tail protein